ncbi:MAG TPA: amidohydrolase family protein [Anaeromyxobacteraceae bacterium]|nr:amidohydrolase family protein [Anaeromyxobacteraceae bacterium]
MRVLSAPYLMLGRPEEPEGALPVLKGGALALDGEVVVAVGPKAEIEARHGKAEALEAVLLPALVNAHTHLELSHLRGRISGGEGIALFIELLVAARAKDPGPGRALEEAILELEEAGVAAVGEVTNTLAALPELGRAGVLGSLYHEVYGFSSDRIESALAAAADRRAALGRPAPGLRIAPSPHAVYSTHPQVVASLLRAGPASIHLAEDPDERLFCSRMEGPLSSLARVLGAVGRRPLGRSPVAAVGPALGPRSLVVHAVDLDDDDRAILANSGATVALCPRSNLHIVGRLPDLPRLLSSGIPLAVGTDSLASSPSLSPLAELSVLARAFPDIAPARLLPLAWNGDCVGAPAIGRLEPGASPGVLAAPLAGARPDDPAAWLISVFGAAERPFTWIARQRAAGVAP